MFESLLSAVRGEASGDAALESVREIARFHRVQASPGYDAAAGWVAERLEAYGFNPEWERVAGDGRTRALGIQMPRGWTCRSAHAELIDGAARESLCDYAREKLSLVQRSAPAQGEFPLVAVDDGGDPSHYAGVDVRGAVVLTAGPVHGVHRHAVISRGAAGILSYGRRLFPPVRGADDDADALPYTSFWWSADMPRGWGFVVSPRRGAQLRAALAQGRDLRVRVAIDAGEFDTEIPLLSARIPGRGDGEILVVSHLCHPEPSANDNASGAAALLETARVLATLRAAGAWAPGDHGVRFLWMPELTGTAAWFDGSRERARRIRAALNLDMVGENQAECGSTLLLEHPPCFAGSFAEPLLAGIRRGAQDWVTSYAGPGHYSLTRMADVPFGGGSDHAVLVDPAIGVPCPMLIQWPDRYYHSSHDTPDRCDPRSLALAVRCAATYAGGLAALDTTGARALLDLVARAARRDVLRAVDSPQPERAVAAARLRGVRAIDSVGRLLDEPARIVAARELFDGFCARELPAAWPDARPHAIGIRSDIDARAACPRRRTAGPLEFFVHLLPGVAGLDAAGQAAVERVFADLPGGRGTLDLAWLACDGQRTIQEIAHLVWLESGVEVPAVPGPGIAGPTLHDLFTATATLGMTSWTAAGLTH